VAKDKIGDSVVKIITTQRAPDFLRPWTKAVAQEGSGSGAVIAGKRILTNAHVVQYATQVFVQANDCNDKLPARVEFIGPDIDLAILRLEDESFFDQHAPLPLASGMPILKDKVTVYGYPIGGEQLSVTEGIISRIDYATFYCARAGLRIQVSAALNPGNSGGPAVAQGRIVGLVFSKLNQAENIGYLVAAEEIAAFLEDIADGTYDGRPALFVWFEPTENEALRAKLHLDKETGGVMIAEPSAEAGNPLKKWDVITAIGPQKIDKQGNVWIRDDLSLSFLYMVPKLARQGHVPLTVFREGKTLKLDAPVSPRFHLLLPYLMGAYPRYFIHGPMVFMTATQDLVFGMGTTAQAMLAGMESPLVAAARRLQAADGQELVVLGFGLWNHRISKGFTRPLFPVVRKVNGIAVRNLAHLVEILRDNQGEYVVIEPAGGYQTLVFRQAELAKATDEILTTEDIRSRGSADLMAIWQHAPATKHPDKPKAKAAAEKQAEKKAAAPAPAKKTSAPPSK
jgi:S1-C subfamily serine protease